MRKLLAVSGKIILRTLILTVIFLVIMLLKTEYKGGGGWLISSPSTYARGWPEPYLVWDISKWPNGVEESLTLEELAHDYSENNVFMKERSLVGLLYSSIFWIFISFILVTGYQLFISLKNRKKRII